MAAAAALVLSAAEVRRLLPASEAIMCAERALASISARSVLNPVRWGMVLPLQAKSGVHVLGHMPAYLPDDVVHPGGGRGREEWFHPVTQPDGKSGSGGWLATKVVSVFPSNSAGNGFPSHQGVVLLFEAQHGSLVCIADAHEVTAIRTAAASAVATRLLSRADARVLALVGAGCQAEQHLYAMLSVRPAINEVRVWSRTAARAASFAEKHSRDGISVVAVPSVAVAVQGADIICTVTPSEKPLVHSGDISAGVHINAVGACFPTQRELDSAVVQQSRLFVDTRAACLKEPGDLVVPLREEVIGEGHLLAEIGELLAGTAEGRLCSDDVTVFKSVGAAVEDLCAAVCLYERATALAQEAGPGTFPTM